MIRLIERGLMYGNLVRVSSPSLVQRYNRALDRLIGRQTGLETFHIDLSGFSPEIGHEFEDDTYLNPNGCNRQFILLSPRQEACPLIGAHFSSSRSILRRFIADNRESLFALSARDAVIGELENSIYRIGSLADVLEIRSIRAEIDTARGLISDARNLEDEIESFEASDTAWWDDVALARMITLADKVGDIQRHPIVPQQIEYRQGNFFTTHFGGLYVFRDVAEPAVIACTPDQAGEPAGGLPLIPMSDRPAIAEFLQENRLVQAILDAPGLDAQGLLRQRLDFILVDFMARDEDPGQLDELTRHDLRSATRRHIDDLPQAFHDLAGALRAAEQGKEWLSPDPEADGYFYLLRGAAHPDRDLVNHLLAHLTPLDVRQLFICNKDRFYALYSDWGDAKRSYVAEFLAKEYMLDKKGTRLALYGPEEPMDAAPEIEPEVEAEAETESKPDPNPAEAAPPEPEDASFESVPDPWADGPWGARGGKGRTRR